MNEKNTNTNDNSCSIEVKYPNPNDNLTFTYEYETGVTIIKKGNDTIHFDNNGNVVLAYICLDDQNSEIKDKERGLMEINRKIFYVSEINNSFSQIIREFKILPKDKESQEDFDLRCYNFLNNSISQNNGFKKNTTTSINSLKQWVINTDQTINSIETDFSFTEPSKESTLEKNTLTYADLLEKGNEILSKYCYINSKFKVFKTSLEQPPIQNKQAELENLVNQNNQIKTEERNVHGQLNLFKDIEP